MHLPHPLFLFVLSLSTARCCRTIHSSIQAGPRSTTHVTQDSTSFRTCQGTTWASGGRLLGRHRWFEFPPSCASFRPSSPFSPVAPMSIGLEGLTCARLPGRAAPHRTGGYPIALVALLCSALPCPAPRYLAALC
ncbi:hypothetical protein LX32DRAFT_642715 [Colletotrichum zoysiae]|uniref:Secreted protein n=1 Tax=Colletotrichum zoysiae TaxID=1216348 RepID=A0AAD9LX00_9PEZI|nr:hypothetical protein LX32DRAFT_642715 [Colletotrichum zoysiae]